MPDALTTLPDGEVRTRRIPVIAYVRDRETEGVMREVLADLLREGGQVRRGDVADAKTGLQQMETPAALIVDVSGEKDPFVALEDLAQFVEPGVHVLVIGERADMEFYRQVTRGLGVLEYLSKPVNRDQIAREFLPWITGRGPSDVSARGGRLIGVTGRSRRRRRHDDRRQSGCRIGRARGATTPCCWTRTCKAAPPA